MIRRNISVLPLVASMLVGLLPGCPALAQNGPGVRTQASEETRIEELNAKLERLAANLDAAERELAESRKQIQELRAQVASATEAMKPSPPPVPSADPSAQAEIRDLQQSTAILQAEVRQHDQIKVESASKYPVRVSGLLLMTSNLSDGAVDNVDLPLVALPRTEAVSHGSLATTWRQTILGLNGRGPTFGRAHSAADLRVDFFGGEPVSGYSATSGALRLRTAHAGLSWPSTSFTAALDQPLISPLSPTSYLTVAEPALAWAGNLWVWSPQLEFNRIFGSPDAGHAGLTLGVIDTSSLASYFNPQLRQANPAEAARQPGYETRISFAHGEGERRFSAGVGGLYQRQKYPYRQRVDSWVGTADWFFPMNSHFDLSGEIYRGRALAGLGGGAFQNYVRYGKGNEIEGLNAMGGWTQVTARVGQTFEFNTAIGQDSAFADQLREGSEPGKLSPYTGLNANRAIFANVVFRPRSYLLFSLEYRHLESWRVNASVANSQIVGLSLGYFY